MSSKKSRRKFLQEFGALSSSAAFLSSPLGMLVNSVISSAITRNMAHAAGLDPRRYVNIQFPGAPPRWMFDLLINAYGTTDTLNLGGSMVATNYTASGGRLNGVEYRTVLRNGLRVPWIWQYSVPAPGNTMRPMTDLLPNLLVLQGITTGNPGHTSSQKLHFKPSGATSSLGALSADNSNALIPAINFNAESFVFASLKNKAAVPIGNNGNMLQSLLSPFISQASASFKNKKDSVSLKDALRDVASALNSMKQTDQLNTATLIESQKNAEELLNGSFGDLNTEWTALLNKYQNLIDRSLKLTIPGINDLPVGDNNPTARGLTYQLRRDQVVRFADLRELLNSPNINITGMAGQFAVTEYVLKNNLSYSMTMSFQGLAGYKTATGMNTVPRHEPDEHYTGLFPSLISNAMLSFATASCLLELIASLKTANLWQDTLIDMGGEFNRMAMPDGAGSEHGQYGKSVSLLSGAYNEPLVLGNIVGANNVNGWGRGAPVAGMGRQLQLNDMVSTIAYLLRTPSPLTSANSLVSLNGNVLVPSIEKARRV